GRVVLRIEVENEVLAREIGERHGLAVRTDELERRRLLAFFDRQAAPPRMPSARSGRASIPFFASSSPRIRRADVTSAFGGCAVVRAGGGAGFSSWRRGSDGPERSKRRGRRRCATSGRRACARRRAV